MKFLFQQSSHFQNDSHSLAQAQTDAPTKMDSVNNFFVKKGIVKKIKKSNKTKRERERDQEVVAFIYLFYF